MVYVYELINLYGTVEWVGESIDPNRRLYQHTKCKPRADGKPSSQGTFYNRQDLIMNIVANFATKPEARKFEGELKKLHGLEHTEVTAGKNAGLKTGKRNAQIIRTCPHCGKTGRGLNMLRWHMDNCKYR